MKKSSLTSLVTAGLIIFFQSAAAQNFDFKDKKCDCDCFRGKPLSECKSYWVLETGFMWGVNDGTISDEYEIMSTLNFGKMFNLNKKSSIGGIMGFVSNGNGVSLGIGPRYRHWISNRMGLDLSPQVLFAKTGGSKIDGFGYKINGSIAIGELFSIEANYLNISYKPTILIVPGPIESGYQQPIDKGFYFGMSGRSYAAPVAPAMYLLFKLLFKDVNIGSAISPPY